jgi:hypothetical protein
MLLVAFPVTMEGLFRLSGLETQPESRAVSDSNFCLVQLYDFTLVFRLVVIARLGSELAGSHRFSET